MFLFYEMHTVVKREINIEYTNREKAACLIVRYTIMSNKY